MKDRMKSLLGLLAFLFPLMALAEADSDLRDAVAALTRTTYTWETTIRQRFRGDSTEPRLDLNAAIEVRGKTDPNGFTEITWPASREMTVPMTVVMRQGDLVAHTPEGWLRRTEIRQVPGADREVPFEGKQVRLSRVLGAALKVAATPLLTEELFDLIMDLKSCRRVEGAIIGELRERTIEQLWRDAQAKRAPEVQGTVIFKFNEQGLTEYHTLLAIGFPNSRTKKTAWSVQQWSTRITGIGSTRVDPPTAAVEALDK